MRDKSHASAQLSDEVFRRQRVAVSTLGLKQLVTWIAAEDMIAAGVQLRLLKHPTVTAREALAKKANLLPQVLDELIDTGNNRILIALGMNPSLEPEFFDRILREGSLSVAERLSHKAPSLTKSQCDFFRTHAVAVIRQNFAGRTDLSDEDTLLMFRSEGKNLQSTLMHNISLESALLAEILEGNDEELLGSLSRRSDLSEELQLLLLEKAPKAAATGMGWRAGTSVRVLDKIFEGDINPIARGLSHANNLRKEHQIKLLESSDIIAHANIARNANTSADLLRSILEGKYGAYAKTAAYSNPNAPWDLLEEGFLTGGLPVLREMARNKNLPPEIKTRIVLLDDPHVISVLGWNESIEISPDSPMALVQVKNGYKKELSPEMELMKKDVDEGAWNSLSPSWSGTFRELIETCRVLGSEL